MTDKINQLKNWQAALIIILVGLAVFSSGLHNQFLGDDFRQIVDSTPVHSITHIKSFFEGGTFYDASSNTLVGVYYRPLMITTFSLIYSLFGPYPIYFHLFQLLLCIASAIILYLFLRYPFRPAVALFLSLIFLVHPLNSQVIFTIASLQDALFVFFGISALYLLIRFKTVSSLFMVAICLLLSLLSKEAGIFFVVLAFLYLFLWDRVRLYPFIGIMILPMVLYLALKTNAIGFLGSNPNNAPIDRLDLAGRLLTAPSIMLFFISKFIFPWKLASGYYWIHPSFSLRYFLLPLAIDLAVLSLIVYAALILKSKASKEQNLTFLFFAAWTLLSLLPYLQIIPLDMTVCEAWFYLPMAGVLGMLGVALTTLRPRIRGDWLLILAAVLIGILGLRTALRGLDWKNQYSIAYSDVKASPDDYNAYNTIANQLIHKGNYVDAKPYALKSVKVNPNAYNTYTLGVDLALNGDYPGAEKAYEESLHYKYSSRLLIYENLGELTLVNGNKDANLRLLSSALKEYPEDSKLWMYLAVLEYKYGYDTDAKTYILKAANYGQIPGFIYDGIMSHHTLKIQSPDLNTTVTVP